MGYQIWVIIDSYTDTDTGIFPKMILILIPGSPVSRFRTDSDSIADPWGKGPKYGPWHSQGYLIMLLWVLKHLFGALRALRSLINCQNTHFSTFGAKFLGPLVAKSKSGLTIPCGLA